MQLKEIVHYAMCDGGDYAAELYRVEDSEDGLYWRVAMVEMIPCGNTPTGEPTGQPTGQREGRRAKHSFSLSPQRNVRTLKRLWWQLTGEILRDENIFAAGIVVREPEQVHPDREESDV